jgi:uncharacterized membrane protein YccC
MLVDRRCGEDIDQQLECSRKSDVWHLMAIIIDTLIGIVVAGGAWYIAGQAKELKRVEILLNRTREDYVTRVEQRDDMRQVMEALHRVEDKLDRALGRD